MKDQPAMTSKVETQAGERTQDLERDLVHCSQRRFELEQQRDDLLAELQFVLDQAEGMGCNCATTEQVNRGHNKDCPANQKNGLFKSARATIAKAKGERNE